MTEESSNFAGLVVMVDVRLIHRLLTDGTLSVLKFKLQ